MHTVILLRYADNSCTSLSKDLAKGRFGDLCIFSDCMHLLPHDP